MCYICRCFCCWLLFMLVQVPFCYDLWFWEILWNSLPCESWPFWEGYTLDFLEQGASGWLSEDMMVKFSKSCWDFGRYAMVWRGSIGILWLHKCGSRMFTCLLFWAGWWRVNFHNPSVGSQYPSMVVSLFLLTMTLCFLKVTIHSSSHNFSIEMRLDWRLGKISAFFWLDNFFSGIWDWCVDAIVDKLGSFTLIGFPDGSLVWNIVVRESR